MALTTLGAAGPISITGPARLAAMRLAGIKQQIFGVLAANGSGLARETRELEQFIPRWRDESVLQQERER